MREGRSLGGRLGACEGLVARTIADVFGCFVYLCFCLVYCKLLFVACFVFLFSGRHLSALVVLLLLMEVCWEVPVGVGVGGVGAGSSLLCVCMYVCMYVGMYLFVCVCVCICMFSCIFVCMHVRMYVCMYVCM